VEITRGSRPEGTLLYGRLVDNRMRLRPAATYALLILLAGMLFAAATPSQAAARTKPCWERVIDDWLNNRPIEGKYSPACLQQALKNIPEDLRDYSNVADAIAAALDTSLHPGSGNGTPGSGSGTSNGNGNVRTPQGVPPGSYWRQTIDSLGTTSADSLPIPLLVLAGLGTALLLAAGGLAANKRLKARARPTAPPV
jgi:hypothetical protein